MPADGEEPPLPKESYLPSSGTFFLSRTDNSDDNDKDKKEEKIAIQTNSQNNQKCILIGRQAATADIRIRHGSISRKHAIFYYMPPGKLILQHLGGKHGTHVNNEQIREPTILKKGDTIFFGKAKESLFTVEEEDTKSLEQKDEREKPNNNDDGKKSTHITENGLSDKKKTEIETENTTRSERESQIAAMVASLEEKPTYKKYQASSQKEEGSPYFKNRNTPNMSKIVKIAEKYDLPIEKTFSIESPTTYNESNQLQKQQPLKSLVIDKSGSRFAVGQGPYLRLYDFSGMDRIRTKPFQTIIVEDGYTVEHLCYSSTGDRLLIGTSSTQPTILDRDGKHVIQFVRGDPYVMDMMRTSGHVNAVTDVSWHPLERDIVLTSSMDGSARQWDLQGKTQFHKLVCDKVYRAKNAQGQRTQVTSVMYHPGGRQFALGTSCGTLQLWNSTRITPRPDRMVINAHNNGLAITSVVYNHDGTQIATRNGGRDNSNNDDVIHLWDTRRLTKSSKPILSFLEVPTVHENANCDFSPTGKFLIVGCSQYKEKNDGSQHNSVYEVGSMKVFSVIDGDGARERKAIIEIPIAKDGVGAVQVRWHAKLNQILVGCSDASIIAFYGERMSRNGAIISAGKAGKTVDSLSALLASRVSSNTITGEIILPFASGEDHRSKKRKKEEEGNIDLSSSKARRPEPPASGNIKVGGMSSASATFNQFISAKIRTNTKIIAGRDPREDLFKYHKEEESEKQKKLLAKKTAEEEEENLK